MNSINPEENPKPPAASGEADVNDLEDTRPRRVNAQPAEPPQASQPAEQAAADISAAQPIAVFSGLDAAPETPDSSHALEDTNPVKVRRSPEAASSEAASSEAASIEDTHAAFTSPAAAPAFDETIPPPPFGMDGVEVPAAAAAAQTSPVPVQPQPARKPASAKPGGKPGQKKAPPGKKPPTARPQKAQGSRGLTWILIPIMGLVILFLVAGASAFGGYLQAIRMRVEAASTQSAQSVQDQYQLGLQDMAEGNFYRARQRFEYVIQLDPSFPGATEKLAEALLYLNATATPTVQPTPTITPTPDTRAVEELYTQAQQGIQNSDWEAAITALLALRSKDINYHVVDVDGMLFIALRNRGREKITKAELESGIYDLTLAGNFGPLDSEAQALLNWSQMYITGASFWDLDWAQAVEYFSQIAPAMPSLMDSSRMTSTERYRVALFEYGNTFARQGQACKALELYQQSLNVGPSPSGEVEQAVQNAAQACQGGGQGGNETPNPNKPGKKNKTPTPGNP